MNVCLMILSTRNQGRILQFGAGAHVIVDVFSPEVGKLRHTLESFHAATPHKWRPIYT